MKANGQVGALTASLEQARKVVNELRKEAKASIQDLGKLRDGIECDKYEGGGLQSKLQRAECE